MARTPDRKRFEAAATRGARQLERWAAKYCDKRKEYDALTAAIDTITKQRSYLASELGEMDALATPAQRRAARAEAWRRGMIQDPPEQLPKENENEG